MEVLVAYDVATSEADGARRLRRVAKACEAHGQRVQKSLFECTLSPMQLEQLLHKLEQLIDDRHDSLRIYRLPAARQKHLQTRGKSLPHDIHEPLVL